MNASQTKPNWLILKDATAVAEFTVAAIIGAADAAIKQRGKFKLVLAGGRTPIEAYRQLARHHADWPRWKIYLGDERCVPPDDEQRNSKAALDAWLGQVAIPAANLFFIAAECGAERAAALYAPQVQQALPFDFVLLGLGEDGHTASLFPGQAEPAGRLVLPIKNAPKAPAERVSLSSAALSTAATVLIVASGEGKRNAVARWRAGEALPVSRISARQSLHYVLDAPAAGDTFREPPMP
jgi:6-phosphogluconolactonase